jgi:2-C-methyl-D-erythritol 4-phosphate cytidylyltransferase
MMPPKTSEIGVNAHPAQTAAIIPAAGFGIRMGGERAKQFLDLNGVPLLAATLRPFQSCPAIGAIILVVPSMDVVFCRQEIVGRFRLDKVKKVVPGGKRRQDSVRLGLEATEGEFDLVVIHDGVRPVITEEFIGRIVAAARTHRAVITAVPAKETVKEISDHGEVVKTYDRERVWLVQTPQVFRYEDILAAHREAVRRGWEEASDDSLLMERMGIPVKVIEGPEQNIKVTTPHDLEVARFLMRQ